MGGVMQKIRVLSLFSGIGGFELGLERTGGFETVAQCEIEPFCRRVLAKHWPNVKRYEDVRELTANVLARDGIGVDVICGGFPCQDISLAGDGAGIEGKRSGLWYEYARLVCELRPGFVLVENVSALLGRGMGRVLGDLAALGYDAEWSCIPAAAVGAQHIRDRVWILAYPQHNRVSLGWRTPDVVAQGKQRDRIRFDVEESGANQTRAILADAIDAGLQGAKLSSIDREKLGGREERSPWTVAERGTLPHWRDWASEPGVGRVVDGVPHRVHRIKGLGNAVVPQIPELIGNAILATLSDTSNRSAA